MRFDDFDAVVLANVPDFSNETAGALENFVRRGGGLLVFPGGKVNAAFYNSQLANARKLLPATLGEPRGDAGQDEKYLTFQSKGYDHPIVSLWNDNASGTLATARFFRTLDLTLMPAPPAAAEADKSGKKDAAKTPAAETGIAIGSPKAILRYSDGSVAMAERAFGLGRVVLFASTADTAWTDLAVRPAFVPLLHRTLGTLVQRSDDGSNLRVGQHVARRLTQDLLNKEAVVMAPGAAAGTRDLRRIELVNGAPLLSYDATDRAGLYEVSVADPPTVIKFATQPDPSESNLSELPPDEVKALGQVAVVERWSPMLQLRELVEKARVGAEYWLPILILVLLCAALETFLAQYFSRAK